MSMFAPFPLGSVFKDFMGVLIGVGNLLTEVLSRTPPALRQCSVYIAWMWNCRYSSMKQHFVMPLSGAYKGSINYNVRSCRSRGLYALWKMSPTILHYKSDIFIDSFGLSIGYSPGCLHHLGGSSLS